MTKCLPIPSRFGRRQQSAQGHLAESTRQSRRPLAARPRQGPTERRTHRQSVRVTRRPHPIDEPVSLMERVIARYVEHAVQPTARIGPLPAVAVDLLV
jgi:hypothetical protein